MLSITPPPAKKKMERLHRVGINSVNAEQLLERITSPEHCNILSGSCALGSFDGGLWIFHICLGELAQVTCMCTRFENLWLRGRLSTRPLPNPCLIYRYFCCKSMFAFLEKKKKNFILQNCIPKVTGLMGKVGWVKSSENVWNTCCWALTRIIRNSGTVTASVFVLNNLVEFVSP